MGTTGEEGLDVGKNVIAERWSQEILLRRDVLKGLSEDGGIGKTVAVVGICKK